MATTTRSWPTEFPKLETAFSLRGGDTQRLIIEKPEGGMATLRDLVVMPPLELASCRIVLFDERLDLVKIQATNEMFIYWKGPDCRGTIDLGGYPKDSSAVFVMQTAYDIVEVLKNNDSRELFERLLRVQELDKEPILTGFGEKGFADLQKMSLAELSSCTISLYDRELKCGRSSDEASFVVWWNGGEITRLYDLDITVIEVLESIYKRVGSYLSD